MPPKTPSRAAAGAGAGAGAGAAAATTTAASSSAILRSAFSSPSSQWSLFASVVQGLDAQRLRVHEVSSLRLVAEHALQPKEQVLCLDWALVPSTTGGGGGGGENTSAKKRRRTGDDAAVAAATSSGSALLAFGTNFGAVKLYSPAENKVVSSLEGQHERAVVDVKFTAGSFEEAYSLGVDGKLCRWDLKMGRCVKSLSLPSAAVSTLSRPVPSNPSVLVASQTPFLVNLDGRGDGDAAATGENANAETIVSFAAMKNAIHTLIASSTSQLSNTQFLAADADRYINLFDIEKRKLLGNLVAAKEVELLTLRHSPKKQQQQQQQPILAAVTRDGTVELFTQPFTMTQQQQQQQQKQNNNAASLKSLRKSQTRRSSASLTLRRPNSPIPIPIIAAQFTSDGDLLLAYVENGVIPIFEKVTVVDKESGELSWSGKKEVVREKTNSLGALSSAIGAGVNGVAGKEVRVDESRTVVESGVGGDDMDVDEEDEDNDKDGESGDDASDTEAAGAKQTPRRKAIKDSDAMDVDKASDDEKKNNGEKEEEDDEEDDNAEPSFGDLIKAQEVVDVEATLLAAQTQKNASTTDADDALVPSVAAAAKSKSLGGPGSGVSLSNVLSQALKTNDNNLLESCFHTTDTAIVRATIQRIDSALAATLLQRLAERLSTRPGRYGHLLVWVQWTCVAHGGSIAGKPGLLRQLTDVFKVMEQRSASLAPLLLLKGKLDMLDAQLGLRRALKGEERRREEEVEDEDNVIYVEGMEDIEDEGDDDDDDERVSEGESGGEGRLLIEEARTGATPAAKKLKRKRDAKEAGLTDADLEMFSDGEEEESGDGMPLTVNDVDSDDSENEEASSDEELVDEEAEVSGEDASEDDEDDENGSDMNDFINDDVSEEEEEEEKPKKKSGKKGKGGR